MHLYDLKILSSCGLLMGLGIFIFYAFVFIFAIVKCVIVICYNLWKLIKGAQQSALHEVDTKKTMGKLI